MFSRYVICTRFCSSLFTAIITISEESDVAEMIALTFSFAILYSLCQPVPQKERTFVCPKKMMSDMSMEGAALILAAGEWQGHHRDITHLVKTCLQGSVAHSRWNSKLISDRLKSAAELMKATNTPPGYLSAIPSNAYLKQLQEAAGGATFVAGLTDNASGPECENGTDDEAVPDGAEGTECDAAGAEVSECLNDITAVQS